eukprot:c37367_g1_i1 orf=3-233(-)
MSSFCKIQILSHLPVISSFTSQSLQSSFLKYTCTIFIRNHRKWSFQPLEPHLSVSSNYVFSFPLLTSHAHLSQETAI